MEKGAWKRIKKPKGLTTVYVKSKGYNIPASDVELYSATKRGRKL